MVLWTAALNTSINTHISTTVRDTISIFFVYYWDIISGGPYYYYSNLNYYQYTISKLRIQAESFISKLRIHHYYGLVQYIIRILLVNY